MRGLVGGPPLDLKVTATDNGRMLNSSRALQLFSVTVPSISSALRCIILVLIAFVGMFAAHPAEARRHRHHSRSKKHAAIINEKKLYERIGGKSALNEITDEWVRNGLSDERISAYFTDMKAKPEKLAKFRRALNDQLCEISDGPCQPAPADLKKFKDTLKFDDWHIVAFAEDLFKALEKRSVGEREKNELLGRVGWLRADLLGLPSRPSPMPN